MQRLEKMGLIHLVDGHEYDDIVALEIAFASDGVIVSNDQFAYVIHFTFVSFVFVFSSLSSSSKQTNIHYSE